MENFPSNSREPKKTSDPERDSTKKVIRLVDTAAIHRKKTLGTRFVESFGGSDGKSVLEYVVFEVLAPAAKDMIVDAITEGARRAFFGETGSNNRRGGGGFRPGGSRNGPVSYNQQYGSSSSGYGRRDDSRGSNRRSRGSHDTYEIILPTRREADEILTELIRMIEEYQAVSVDELYEMVGIEFTHVDRKWGWTDLRDADASRVSDGYRLNLPRAEALDN